MESLVWITSTIAAEIRDDIEAQALKKCEEATGSSFGSPKLQNRRRMNRIQPKQRDSTGAPEVYCVQILHLEDSANDAALILDVLEDGKMACAVTHALNRADFETAIEHDRFDIILCDHRVPGYTGFAALEFAKEHQPNVPVVILSGVLDDEQAVQSLKHGASDYILKDRMARLVPAIRQALDEADDEMIRAAVEDRIREQANLLNVTRDAILLRNMNDQIVYWNPGAENLFGWSATEAMGQDFSGLLKGDPARLDDARTTLLQSGDWLGEILLKKKTGQDRTVMSRWNLLRGKDGQPRSILTTNTDVTDMKRL
jgi:two-component system, cell cycle sensor histidine kinase and response regulator CckA